LKKLLLIVGALVLGLTGLLMSVCGGGFIVASLGDRNGAMGIIPIAAAALFVGLLLLWGCYALFKRADRDDD
jgi:hypothetical protein